MKTVIRILLLDLAVLFGLVSLWVPWAFLEGASNNKKDLADMQDCVRAIKEFESTTGRLPTDAELSKIEDSLPKRYSPGYNFHFGEPPSQPEMHYPVAKPASEGWMIWYWAGEQSEYYSSWDDQYSLEKQVSWREDCWHWIFAPLIAAVFFALSSLPAFRTKP